MSKNNSSNGIVNLLNEGDEKTRIRIGLSWDPISTKITAHKIWYKKESFLANLFIIPMWILGMIWATAVFIVSLGRIVKFPTLDENSFSNTETAYDTADRSKQNDNEDVRENSVEYDIDLYCMAQKHDGTFVKVGPEDHNMLDPTENIVHSGDEDTGQGVFDDETISLDLKTVTNEYTQFYFYITSDNKHDFASYDNAPTLRIVESYSEAEITKHEVATKSLDATGAYGYIFAKIYNDNGTWKAKMINKFCDFSESWEYVLKQY
ncbi:MAG: TerD family protein [Alphaproteobacteria bacterium]